MNFDSIITFGQRAHQHADVVCLFESSFADLDNVGEVFPNRAPSQSLHLSYRARIHAGC